MEEPNFNKDFNIILIAAFTYSLTTLFVKVILWKWLPISIVAFPWIIMLLSYFIFILWKSAVWLKKYFNKKF